MTAGMHLTLSSVPPQSLCFSLGWVPYRSALPASQLDSQFDLGSCPLAHDSLQLGTLWAFSSLPLSGESSTPSCYQVSIFPLCCDVVQSAQLLGALYAI